MADETFGGGEEVVEADAEADFLNDLGRISMRSRIHV